MQHKYEIPNQAGAGFRADLNEVLMAIVSNNSGPTEPEPSFAFQFWADTTSGQLKQRNAGNNAWLVLFDLKTGLPDGVVLQTSATGVGLFPEGNNAQRPPGGSIPAGFLAVRGNTENPQDYWAEFWDRSVSKWKAFADRTWVGKQIEGFVALVDSAVQSVKDWVNQQIGFAIIYPNGGSAASPANIAINSRYVLANPFPGKLVICEVQLLIGGVWGGVGGFIYSTASGSQAFGVLARQYGDSIVVQTGVTALLSVNNFDGNPFPGSGNLNTPTPARVVVSKVKGAV